MAWPANDHDKMARAPWGSLSEATWPIKENVKASFWKKQKKNKTDKHSQTGSLVKVAGLQKAVPRVGRVTGELGNDYTAPRGGYNPSSLLTRGALWNKERNIAYAFIH